MLPRNLRISRTLFGFALICFFLPFVSFPRSQTFSGINVIFNFVLPEARAAAATATAVHEAAQVWTLVALGLVILGLAATFMRRPLPDRAAGLLLALLAAAAAGALGLSAVDIGVLLDATASFGLALGAIVLALLAIVVVNLWALVQPARFVAVPQGGDEGPPPPWYLSWRVWEVVLLAAPVVALGWLASEISLGDLYDGLTDPEKGGRRLLAQLLDPNLDWEFMKVVLARMGVSILQALMATVFAVVFAVPLSFFAARNLMRGSSIGMAIYYVMRGLFNVFRSLEVLVVAILFVTIVGIGPFAGMLGLLIHTIAVLGKLYSEQIENIDPGPMEAIAATGASRLQTVLYAVVPQVVNPFIAFTIYRWDVNVRMSVIVGFVGGGGVGQLLYQYQGQLKWAEVSTIALVTIVVVWVMDYASARIREKLL